MNLNQTLTLMKRFIESQLTYCPLVWMCNGRIVNKKLATCMKGPYKVFIKIIQALLKTYLKEINLSLTIHHSNIQSLAIDLFKVT